MGEKKRSGGWSLFGEMDIVRLIGTILMLGGLAYFIYIVAHNSP